MIVWLIGWPEGLHVDTPSYRGFRYPPEIIAHCVWLYHRVTLSRREVEELMFERGIEVSDETIHQWAKRFGPADAATRRRRRPTPGDKWHLDEVYVKLQGRQRSRWRGRRPGRQRPGHPAPETAGHPPRP